MRARAPLEALEQDLGEDDGGEVLAGLLVHDPHVGAAATSALSSSRVT